MSKSYIEPESIWGWIIYFFLFIGFYNGYRLGFLSQVFFLAATSSFYKFFPSIEAFFTKVLSYFNLDESVPVDMVCTFFVLGTLFYLLVMLRQLVQFLLSYRIFSISDGLLGGLIGLFEMATLLGIVILSLESINLSIPKDTMFYKELSTIAHKVCSDEMLATILENAGSWINTIYKLVGNLMKLPSK